MGLGKSQSGRRLSASLRQARPSRQRAPHPDQLSTHRHRGGKLLRRSRLPQYSPMILVTGGTGFVGSHLLDLLSARGEPARCLLRPTPVPRRLPPGIEAAPGDLITGRGLDSALDGVDTVIHLAGVTKALSPAAYYQGNAHATQIG